MKVCAFALWASVICLVGVARTGAIAGTTKVDKTLVLRLTSVPAAVASPIVKVVEEVPEIDPTGLEPRAGEPVALAPGFGSGASWEERGLAESGLAWRVFYASVDRFAEVTIRVVAEGEASIFVNGVKQTGKANWRRGKHTVLVRTTGAVTSLELETADSTRVEIALDPGRELTAYGEVRQLGSVGDLVLSPDGRFLAYVAKNAHPTGAGQRRLEVFDHLENRKIATGLLGAATPLAFTSTGADLLVRTGDDVFLWRRESNEIVDVLRAEAGLGAIALSSDASFVVYSSTRGVTPPKKDGPKRRRDLREKLSDWPTAPHLFVAALGGASKRRLTLPGDCAHDSFALYPDDRRVLWTRSVPLATRPWFETEFHELSLENGTDRLITTLRMGFENRPGLTEIRIAPDGKRAAFLAPRSELGERAPVEPNVFDPDLFVLDLESGAVVNNTLHSDISPEPHLAWASDGSRLYFTATKRAVSYYYSLSRKGDTYGVSPEPGVPFPGALGAVALSPSGAVAGVFSAPDVLPELHSWSPDFGKGSFAVAEPNRVVAARRRFVAPERFQADEGEQRFDAWLYRPSSLPADSKVPVVVYYYGGATPTMFGFSDTHQYLVANGYAVLVVNPRGCGGYGDEWSLAHVGDWGEVAGQGIVAALDAALEKEPRLDGSKVGCYGGSYGGFMTLWLASRYPERFHAAVSMYGISNLASYFGEGQWGFTYGDQAMATRYPWTDEEYFVKHSPLFHAENVKAAVLLLHGEVDSNVTITESEQMFTALDLLGREVELVRFPNEDHGLRGTIDNRIAHREMILDWFDKHLRGQPEAWNARW